MPPKAKAKNVVSIVPETVDQISLSKYCPKEIFDVLFVSEEDENSRQCLDRVIEISRQYEDISCITFITYDEVMDLIKHNEKVIVPPRVKITLQEVCNKILNVQEIDGSTISSKHLAELMKLKLIEVMYHHYINEVKKMQKRKKLEEDLDILTKECKKAEAGKVKGEKGGKGSKSAKDSKSGKSTTTKSGSDKKKGKDKGSSEKGDEVKVIEDYTEIPIQYESDVIFDDDIFNHVWFYIFCGFYDPDLMQELYSVNVPLTAVIKITIPSILESLTSTITSSESLNSLYEKYWNRLYKYFDGPERLTALENTILMNFTSSAYDFKEIFQQLLYVIKNISDVKLQHVNYLRHIKIYEVNEIYNCFPLECLSVYNRRMDKIPLELVNLPILLNNLLQEVFSRVDNVKSTTSIYRDSSDYSMRSQNSYSATNCVNPCNIEAFFKSKEKPTPEKILPKQNNITNFLTHECDEINIILNSYKKYGPLLCDPVLSLLKTLKPFIVLKQYLTDYVGVPHKHDIDPATKLILEEEEVMMHIYYLIIFYTFNCAEPVVDFENTELTENLQTYHKIEFINSCQPKILDVIPYDKDVLENVKNEEKDSHLGEAIDEEEEDLQVTIEESIFYEESNFGEEVNSYDDIENESQVDSDRLFPNYYNMLALRYLWKEKLPLDVLLQEIYKAEIEYSYAEEKFSPETNNLLLQFSDRLDEFGINTNIFQQSLITPICLRDFCRYVSVQQADWLENNKPPKYFRKCEEVEVCKGVNKLHQLQLFQEYSHLLDTEIKSENEEEKPTFQGNSVSFDALLHELSHYPLSSQIIDECKKSQKEKTFLAYDLGVKYLQVRGAKITFHSHDDVKITVDNTRFLDEKPKCTISLTSKGNSLILHSNKFYLSEDYTFHLHLADGTIITFIVLNTELRKGRRKTSQYGESSEAITPEERLSEKIQEEEPEDIVEVVDEIKVLSVDRDYFNSLETTGVEEQSGENDLDMRNDLSIFDCLKQAAELNAPIYKINNKLTHLKRLKPKIEIPLTNILNRVLHKAIQKRNFKAFTKRYIPKKQKLRKVKRMFNARIAWPNGLYISFYPSEMKSTYVEVKQEFLTKNLANSLIQQEEFRLFARDGYILIKYIDGTIKILKSNGDTIDFEKLDVNSDLVKKWRLRPCHCKTINDYRKKLNKIMRKNLVVEDEGVIVAGISRRDQFHTKKGYVLNIDLVNMLEEVKVPYLKQTLLKFNGNRICLENGKVTQKRLFHITDEEDFFAQEIYYERSDGFRSYFDRNGKQQVKFADGTKITSTLHVAKQLASGYVYVSLSFEYQHPNYATVLYTQDNSLEVYLKAAVFKMDLKDTISLNIGEDISTTVKLNSVVFNKICPKCNSKYKCFINVKPFNEENFYTTTTQTFLHAQDSYNKHFCTDYVGNCRRNTNYIKGPFNIFNCNHYKKMIYKKMFLVNRNMPGYMFWTDNMVNTKTKAIREDKDGVVIECNDVNDLRVKVIKIRRKIYENYCNRYLNTNLLREQMCLTKYKQEEDRQLVYTTSRVIKKLTDYLRIKKVLEDITTFLVNLGKGTKLLHIFATLLKEIDDYFNSEYDKSIKEISCETVEPAVCRCVKTKINMAGKIERWKNECRKYKELIRNNVINSYFKSEFCQVVERQDVVNNINNL